MAKDTDALLEFLCNKIGFWPENEDERNEILDENYVKILGVVSKDEFGHYDPSVYLCLTHSMNKQQLNSCLERKAGKKH